MSDWQEVMDAEVGKIFYDAIDNGVRILVMRGPTSMCAYLGCPKDHPLAGFEYDDIPLSVHGGLAFGGEGGKGWPAGWYWYGWDYSHSGDYSTYYDRLTSELLPEGHKWTVKEVTDEAKDATWDFRRIMLLAEKCALKDSGLLLAKK